MPYSAPALLDLNATLWTGPAPSPLTLGGILCYLEPKLRLGT